MGADVAAVSCPLPRAASGEHASDTRSRAPSTPHPAWRGIDLPHVRVQPAHGTILVVCLLTSLTVEAATGADRPGILATLWQWTPLILTGFALNVLMSVVAMAIGTVAGLVLGIGQISQGAFVRRLSRLLTEFFRNAPWLVLLFYCMFLLPFEIRIGSVTVPLPGWLKAVFGLSLSVMANMSEIARGALQAVPSTQWEAAEALAFPRISILWRIILPQCIKPMLPPWMNLYALLIMTTPLASVLGVNEALGMTQSAVNAVGRPEMLAPFYLYLLAFFFFYSYPISAYTIRLERRYAVRI